MVCSEVGVAESPIDVWTVHSVQAASMAGSHALVAQGSSSHSPS